MSQRTDRTVQYGTTGAAIGSVVPGIGTTAGAIGGAAYGWLTGGGGGGLSRSAEAEKRYGGVNAGAMQVPGYGQQYKDYGSIAKDYANQQSGFRNLQRGFGSTLEREAHGKGVGQALVAKNAQLAADRAGAQQFGAIAGARPGMQAMAARNAQLGTALAQSAVGEQAAVGSAQMTLGAQQQYAQHLANARQQDIGQQSLNNQSQLEAYRQRMQLAGLQQTGAMTAEQLRTQRYNALLGAPTQGEITMGGLTGLGSAIFSMNQQKKA
jgi:hypothetical protein